MHLTFLKYEEPVTKKKFEILRWEKEVLKPKLECNEGGGGSAKKNMLKTKKLIS